MALRPAGSGTVVLSNRMVVSAMTTQQPGSSPRRRWLSFSLRGLFIVVTIGCIWLGIVATRARKQPISTVNAAPARLTDINSYR